MAGRGAIIEYDFTAFNGAELLFDVAAGFLRELDGIGFDAVAEARYLAGGNYQGGLQQLFDEVKTKKTSAKAARDLGDRFNSALTEALPGSVSTAFRNFAGMILDKGVKVVVSTRADINSDAVRGAFADLIDSGAVLHQELSTCYGSVKWDSWRRICAMHSLGNVSSVAVTGSGFGVKSALIAGMGAMGVVNDRVAYQDFGGADAVVEELNAAAARTLCGIMKV